MGRTMRPDDYLECLNETACFREQEAAIKKEGWISRIQKKVAKTQNQLDEIGHRIETFANPRQIKEALQLESVEGFSLQGAFALIRNTLRLPFRAANNILTLTYNLIKLTVYGAVHPIKGIKLIARNLGQMFVALKEPNTWSNIGAGLVGGSLGSMLVTGNPLPVTALIVGASLIGLALAVGMAQAAIGAKRDGLSVSNAVWSQLKEQFSEAIEFALTGFLVGSCIGAVESAAHVHMPSATGEHVVTPELPFSAYEQGMHLAHKTHLFAHEPSFIDAAIKTTEESIAQSGTPLLGELYQSHNG
jgi:hypothetical protein